jgi:HAD superfamily hydrolase (TIGR01509 family)
MRSIDPPQRDVPGLRADLPLAGFVGVIFDMDGVITQSASLHFAAWKQLFDTFLARRRKGVATADRALADTPTRDQPTPDPSADPARYRPFDEDDYRRFVDGKPREAGVADFLASRGIHLPHGGSGDPGADVTGEDDTVVGLGLRKNAVFLERVTQDGVAVFPTTLAFLERVKASGRRVAVISASENATAVLDAAGVLDRFDVKVDGLDSRRLGLTGKPDPAIFLEAARQLGEPPPRLAVVEDALAGVEAGARGGFGLVVGVDRAGYRDELLAAGASLVVADLGDLLDPPVTG